MIQSGFEGNLGKKRMTNQIREMDTIIYEKRGRIAVLTLNRPSKLNTIDDRMLDEMYACITELDHDDEVRVIVIKGAGRAFCAGHDLSPREEPFTKVLDWRNHARHDSRMLFAIWNCKKPVISQIHGYCMGGGCDLASVCDFTIAAESAVFGKPEIQFNSAAPFRISRYVMGMKRVKSFLLMGERLTAAEAEHYGLVTTVVPDDKLEEEVMALAKKLVKIPEPAMRLNKEAINRSYEMAGLVSSIHYGENIFATVLMSETPESARFFEIANAEGLSAAFKWRDAQFVDDFE